MKDRIGALMWPLTLVPLKLASLDEQARFQRATDGWHAVRQVHFAVHIPGTYREVALSRIRRRANVIPINECPDVVGEAHCLSLI
jgi:hypothetical protein